MATRPSLFPRWAETSGGTPASNIQEPNTKKKDVGHVDDEQPPSGILNWLLWLQYKWLQYLDANQAGPEIFGFGDFGAAAFNGSGAVSGWSRVGSVYTAQQHTFFTNAVVSNGVTLIPDGFEVRCNGKLTLQGTAQINATGADAVGRIGGAIPASGVWFPSAGANGGLAATNGGNSSLTNAIAGAGGAGGGSSDGHTPGTVTCTAPGADKGSIVAPESFIMGMLFGAAGITVPGIGCGGSGGAGGGGGSQGGGGGAGGGLIKILAREIDFSTTCNLYAKGGNGGDGQVGGGHGGGAGGGGGGGAVLLGYHINSGAVSPGTRINVNGGIASVVGWAPGVDGFSGIAHVRQL